MSIDNRILAIEEYLKKAERNHPNGTPIKIWYEVCQYIADLEAEVDELREHSSVLRACLIKGQNDLIRDIMDLVMFADIHEDQTPGAYEKPPQIQHEQLIRSRIMKTLEKTYGVSLQPKLQRTK